MVQVQVRLSERANEVVKIFKVKNKLKTNEEAINILLERNGVEF